MAARPTKEIESATQRNYSKFTAQQKLEIVLAGLRGDRSVKDVCREQAIAETLYYSWRDKLLEGGARAALGQGGAPGRARAPTRVRELERALGPRPTSSRSLGKHCEAGSERARRPVSRAGGPGPAPGRRGARDAGLSPGDLPHAKAAHRPGPAASRGLSRPGDRRDREAQPDRRQPEGRGAQLAGAGPAGESQARPARDATGTSPAAPPAAPATPATGLLPRRAPRPALAHGHDLDLGRRARLVLPERGDRLLHPGDPGLGDRPQVPKGGGACGRRAQRRRLRDRARPACARHRQHRLYLARLPRPASRARDRPPPRWLPRPRVAGLHRVVQSSSNA